MGKEKEIALDVILDVDDTLSVELQTEDEVSANVEDGVEVTYLAPVTDKIDENSTHYEAASAKAVYEYAGNTIAEKVYFDDGQTLAEKYANGELGGNGGGGVDDEIHLNTSSTDIVVAKNDAVILNYNFTREQYTTRSGMEKVYVDGVLKSSRSISQGDNSIDITKYVSNVSHTVELQVSSSGLSASILYNVEIIDLSISSTFDGFGIYGENVTYRYTLTGNVSKTVYFILDNKEVGHVQVEETGKTMLYELKGLSHGEHLLEVYCTAKLGTNTLTSNVLKYSIIVNNGGTSTLLGCPFDIKTCQQGDLLVFNYVVCDPDSLTTPVTLSVNGEVVNELVVDRTKQTWSIRNYPAGNTVFEIRANECVDTFVVNVVANEVVIEPITNQLELHLTSTGRSNNETVENRVKWNSGSTEAVLTGFNWKNNGWIEDNEGDTVLRVNGDARVVIPFNVFANNFSENGKTIEIEFSTKDVIDYDSVLVSCVNGGRGFELTSTLATFSSEQTTVKANFKEDEQVRLSFVVEPIAENRFIYTYVNGVLSGLIQYPDDDDFSQSSPVGIYIGSNDATIDIYNIRVYGIDLDNRDVLTNYIADLQSIGEKTSLNTRNDIFDTYGNINYQKVLKQLPCLTIIGELPGSKGDKKNVTIKYENGDDSTRSFNQKNVVIDVQGTSSQYYPRKNYKFELRAGYYLTNNSIIEKVFCLKADFMESSHSHNTGLAKIVNKIYPTTPPKENDSRVQAAINGFPIVVWHRATETSAIECLGVYNFNNDKDATDCMGYTSEYPNCECWEFKKNDADQCLFKSDDFTNLEEIPEYFEARYPKKYKNYTNLHRVVSWVKSTQNDLNKFKDEFNQYFNKEATLLYYCLTELFAMVDSRAKNLFLTTWDGQVWYPTFYDMDTSFGLNNEGVNSFDYSVEYHDVKGTKNVFNGEDSVLWNNFEEAFADDITAFYKSLRDDDKVTYDGVMKVLYDEQISKICESNYNYDAVEKYKKPFVEMKTDYLYAAQGSRLDHLKWWLSNRFNYMDSKYVASDFKEDFMTLRIYTPTNYGSVEPSGDLEITPYADQYVKVAYDGTMIGERGVHDTAVKINAPKRTFNDTPLAIHGASRISDIGDLSPLYPGTVDVSSGIKLKKLIIGNAASDYSNTNLENLTVGNNNLLTILDVRNCPSLTKDIDVSGCTNIEEVYATGTSTTKVSLPNGGNLKKLHLPETVTNITILNQPFISEFVCGNYSNVSTLRIENTPIDTLPIVQSALASGNLSRIRVLNVNWETTDEELLNKLMTCKGLNENGVNTEKSVLTGKVHIKGTLSTDDLERYSTYFGSSLTVTADRIAIKYKCSFVNYDGTVLYETSVAEGGKAVYGGETPTRPNDDTYTYEFSGWAPNIETTSIISNTTFTAQFTSTPLLVVNWVNYNGEILQTDKVESGSVVSYKGSVPTRPDDAQYKNYYLTGWLGSDGNTYVIGSNVTITSDVTLTAQYAGVIQTYNVYWYNGDTLLGTSTGEYGSTAEYIGDDPVSDEGSFVGWSKTPNSSVAETNLIITGEMYFYAAFDKPDTIEINTHNSSQSPYFTLASTTGVDEEITIDWGDGDVTTHTVTTSGTKCAKPKSYAEGDHTIKLPATENYKFTGVYWQYCYIQSASFKYFRIDCDAFFKTSWSTQTKFTNVSLGQLSPTIGLTKIRMNTFDTCVNLTSITIPEGITEINNWVFRGCTSLTTVTMLSTTPPALSDTSFQNCTSLQEIRVPMASVDTYKSATNWSAYADIIVGY